MKIYFAGPLFSESERDWLIKTRHEIETLARAVGSEVGVCLPCELFTREEIDRLGDMAGDEVFSRLKADLDDSDILIALLDGPQVDDGTAWEVGYFYRNKTEHRKIIGVRTDFRRAGEFEDSRVNVMIERSCDAIARTTKELLDLLVMYSVL